MRLLADEELIREAHPSWRSAVSFHVTWRLVSLAPLLATLAADAVDRPRRVRDHFLGTIERSRDSDRQGGLL